MVHCHLSKGIIGAHRNSLVLSGGGGYRQWRAVNRSGRQAVFAPKPRTLLGGSGGMPPEKIFEIVKPWDGIYGDFGKK
jgi:hypothetical protein